MSKGKDIRMDDASFSKKLQKKPKKEKIKISKELDMLKFKQKISNEMANIPIMKISNCVANNSLTNDAIQKYSELYKKYISEDFSTMCIVFINRLISESTTLPLTIKNSYNVHKTILKIVKELMMNEYEITLFSLLLDQIGWSSTNFIFEDNLFYLAMTIKEKTLKEKVNDIINYFTHINKGFTAQYENWKKDNVNINNCQFSYNQIYIRFCQLKKPYNIYCKTNYIDYNSVVDKILRMSLPYSENKPKEEDEVSSEISKSKENSNYKGMKQNIIQNNTIVTINTNKKIINNNNNAVINQIDSRNNNTTGIFGINHTDKDKKINDKTFLQKKHIFSHQNVNTNQIKKPKITNDLQPKNEIKPNTFNPLQPHNTPSQQSLQLQGAYYNNFGIFPSNTQRTPSQSDFNNLKYFNYPQNSQHPQGHPSANFDYINPMNRASVQTIDSNIMPDDDNLTQILCKSNAKFFGSAFSLKDIYGNDLDPFNIRGSSMMSGKFEQFTQGNPNMDDGLKAMPQPSNSSFTMMNIMENKEDNMVPSTQNIMGQGPRQDEHKKNLLGMYNQLKMQKEKNNN